MVWTLVRGLLLAWPDTMRQEPVVEVSPWDLGHSTAGLRWGEPVSVSSSWFQRGGQGLVQAGACWFKDEREYVKKVGRLVVPGTVKQTVDREFQGCFSIGGQQLGHITPSMLHGRRRGRLLREGL